MMLAVVMFGLSSCDKESEGLTSITYFPIITLDGSSRMIVDKGSQFVDPGYKATLNGEDVTAQVEVTSTVNTSKSGMYSVSYKVVNADGFAATASRTVVVLDPTDVIEGFYNTDPNSYRINSSGAKTVYGDSYEILILGNGDGTYYVDDFLGGYYCDRAGYGARYKLTGDFFVDANGAVTAIDSYLIGWSDGLDGLAGGKYDAPTKTFSWDAQYAGMDFYVTMTKK